MKRLVRNLGALGALLLVAAPALAQTAPVPAKPAAQSGKPAQAPHKASDDDDSSGMDVPAPPMLLLFATGAIGLIWGRRLAAKARANSNRS